MKTKLHLIVLFMLTGALFAQAQTNGTSPKPPSAQPITVAVFDFESKEDGVKNLGTQAATLINANLSANSALNMVERAELEKALGEQEFGLSGTVSSETAAKVGQLTGAKVIITGRVFKTERELFIVTKVIGTETGRVFGQVAKSTASGANISDLAADATKAIVADIAKHNGDLFAKDETREDRLEKIKKTVAGKTLPSVSVRISERHFGGPVIDPAAETEIAMLLQQAGFVIRDEKSNEKPDVEITGDAFSAFGLRRGNLISCKARVELKARDTATSKILVVDRQTSVAVDITEQTSAKTALQVAAAELIERIAHNLVSDK